MHSGTCIERHCISQRHMIRVALQEIERARETERVREMQKQRVREMQRQRERCRDRETDAETERQTEPATGRRTTTLRDTAVTRVAARDAEGRYISQRGAIGLTSREESQRTTERRSDRVSETIKRKSHAKRQERHSVRVSENSDTAKTHLVSCSSRITAEGSKIVPHRKHPECAGY